MEGNSASKPMKSTPNELPCITYNWRMRERPTVHSRDTQHLISQIGIPNYAYKTFFQIRSHIMFINIMHVRINLRDLYFSQKSSLDFADHQVENISHCFFSD